VLVEGALQCHNDLRLSTAGLWPLELRSHGISGPSRNSGNWHRHGRVPDADADFRNSTCRQQLGVRCAPPTRSGPAIALGWKRSEKQAHLGRRPCHERTNDARHRRNADIHLHRSRTSRGGGHSPGAPREDDQRDASPGREPEARGGRVLPDLLPPGRRDRAPAGRRSADGGRERRLLGRGLAVPSGRAADRGDRPNRARDPLQALPGQHPEGGDLPGGRAPRARRWRRHGHQEVPGRVPARWARRAHHPHWQLRGGPAASPRAPAGDVGGGRSPAGRTGAREEPNRPHQARGALARPEFPASPVPQQPQARARRGPGRCLLARAHPAHGRALHARRLPVPGADQPGPRPDRRR
jgi:hypothetical protein